MSSFLLSKEQKGIVVFHIWKSLKYNTRLIISFSLIIVGFVLQLNDLVGVGLLTVFIGNIFLLVKGYNNRIDLKSFKDGDEWVEVSKNNLEQLSKIDKKNQKWDKTRYEITNSQGCGTFVLLFISMFLFLFFDFMDDLIAGFIIVTNVAILFFPHWLSGFRDVTMLSISSKIDVFLRSLTNFKKQLANANITYLLKVSSTKKKIPIDVKVKLEFKNQPENFMGMYFQISMNDVNGRKFPYFYVVLVAKEKTGLKTAVNHIPSKKHIIKEYSNESGVDIIVIRQDADALDSGYFTDNMAIKKLVNYSLNAIKIIFPKL